MMYFRLTVTYTHMLIAVPIFCYCQNKYPNCDNCKIGWWCATVFHNSHSYVVRQQSLKIGWNLIILYMGQATKSCTHDCLVVHGIPETKLIFSTHILLTVFSRHGNVIKKYLICSLISSWWKKALFDDSTEHIYYWRLTFF